MRRVVEWNGRDLPEGLRDLPPGRYVVDDERAPADLKGLRGLAGREACVPDERTRASTS